MSLRRRDQAREASLKGRCQDAEIRPPRAHKLKNEAQENEKRTVKYQSLAGIKKPHPRRYFAGSFGKYV